MMAKQISMQQHPHPYLFIPYYKTGTFEKRPGDKHEYQKPSELHEIGSFQGDEPTGTITSDPFIILGDSISFMIGGGCSDLVYVELLVDGFSALRVTGRCNERMEQVHFQTRDFLHRSGQIRIVDNDSSKWGHINVDHIQFSWDLGRSQGCLVNNWGECSEGGAALPKQNANEKQHYTGREESAMSGAAYMYYRECPPIASLTDSPPACTWVEQERLTASDKRGGDLFGVSVSIDNTQGIAIVASSASSEQTGSVYVFLREPASYGPSGDLIRDPYWRTSEHAKLAPPDVSAGDQFGYSIALGGSVAVMGAIGRDGYAKEGGDAYAYDMEWIRVKFAEPEFVAVEGTDQYVKIFLERDLTWSNSVFSIGYSTSDLSAIGVDTFKYEKCMKLHASERDGCGDYQQAYGEVTFEEGEEFTYFEIHIMDDLCIERDMEYIQLHLHQFGGSILRGEGYRAQLRIDDDDMLRDVLSMECSGGIS